MFGERPGVSDTGDSQRPPEGPAPHRKRETTRIGVQVRAPPRSSTGRIRLDTEDRRAGILSPARRLGIALNRDDP